ncbi:BadF/BadG/BcrA/BcrD ATPase family protein [Clostridium lundense]|uniref:BadF/BadG/BcrA/BcrD ATPase family protein n=1 Tax=Clostridium lundense TaxID=319475 RepID=UPI0004862EFF|nr:BadF/BadG/BcrA/BcrD ATPase family protein [Clostridium lundense]
MKYVVSVDGGGTKTVLAISDLSKKSSEMFYIGCTNYKSIGVEETYNNLRDGFNQLMLTLNIKVEEIEYYTFGFAGCDSRKDYEILADIILRLGIDIKKVYLCNDGVLAYFTEGKEPGIVIISGTGSIVLGIDSMENIVRAGGWGYNFSDLGSGYWISNEVVKRLLLYCDDCYDHYEVFDKIKSFYNISDYKDMPLHITSITNYYEIAELAPIILKCGEDGEKLSNIVINKAISYLSGLTYSIYNKMNFNEDNKITIVLSGGVLKNEFFQKKLCSEIKNRIEKEDITFIVQNKEPVIGGINLALRRLNESKM